MPYSGCLLLSELMGRDRSRFGSSRSLEKNMTSLPLFAVFHEARFQPFPQYLFTVGMWVHLRIGSLPANPSSWGFQAASVSHWPSGYRRAATAVADTHVAATCRWPCIWMSPCCVSLASRPTLDRRTNGSAAIARLSPCCDGLPVLP